MKKVAFAALAGLTMTTAGLAADLAAPVSGEVGGQQYEIGSGWYIRGDIGESLGSMPGLDSTSFSTPPGGAAGSTISPPFGANMHSNNFTLGGGVGYQFAPWLRMDATFDHFSRTNGQASGTAFCPYGATAVGTSGILYDPTNTCNGSATITNVNNVGLINAYYDMPAFGGLVPYVGAGAGINVFNSTGSLAYTQTNTGQTYNANTTVPAGVTAVWVNASGTPVTPQPNVGFGPQNWNRALSQTKVSLAVALMAGVAYHFNDWVTLDVGYRYLNADVFHPTTNYSNEIRAGVRLYAN